MHTLKSNVGPPLMIRLLYIEEHVLSRAKEILAQWKVAQEVNHEPYISQ